MVKRLHFILVIQLLILAACSNSKPALRPTVPVELLEARTSTPSATWTIQPSPTFNPTATNPTKTPESTLNICPPLPDYSQEQLIEAISNPFHPPSRPGSDDPHQAVDLAVTEYGMAMQGNPVQLVLGGRVAAVIKERFPYGNALMIETPLEQLPDDLEQQLGIPTPAPTLGPHPSLNCPPIQATPQGPVGSRSLYLLYAHMGEVPDFQLGDALECGVQIGVIGESGNALHPHLHLEARVGPGDARFNSMAHYETRASPEEMWSYCTWRVSGIFQLVDATQLLFLLP